MSTLYLKTLNDIHEVESRVGLGFILLHAFVCENYTLALLYISMQIEREGDVVASIR